VRDEDGSVFEVTWADAVNTIAEQLAHYQGDVFAALASPDSTNEEVYALQLFTRAVMGTNNIDRMLTPAQRSVEMAIRAGLGDDVSNTNNMQELFSDVRAAMVVGPDLGKAAPVASYWFYHSKLYREARTVVISMDDYPLCRRSEFWLKPHPGTTASLLRGIAHVIVNRGLGSGSSDVPGYQEWLRSIETVSVDQVAAETGVPTSKIEGAAVLWATGGAGAPAADGATPAALIYQTLAHQSATAGEGWYGDPAEIAAACTNLAMLTGNIGRAGGGVAAMRGPANYQGATQMGAHPDFLPGGGSVDSTSERDAFSQVWLARWAERARTSNGFVPVRNLPSRRGLSSDQLIAAIENGQVKAMIIDGTIAGRDGWVDPKLGSALDKLEFLVVIDMFNSPLAEKADFVLPKAATLEKDGTLTNFDRTVQRVRAAVPAIGEAKPVHDFIGMLSERMGYGFPVQPASQIMAEIGRLVDSYGGVTYARLERGGAVTPVASHSDPGSPILVPGPDGRASLSLAYTAVS
jgi:predicted molibdopterin-dependent oxidoreductase YjgC